jgi:cell division protein FtsZ
MTVELKPRIVVFGVGGAGGNAVNNMIEAKLQGVEFVVANTDAQALSRTLAPHKIQLGARTTQGLGAGARPEIGSAAAEESMDEIAQHLEGAHMVFVASGMGGGTGTGSAPVVARAARERGILTVGVVTKPFQFEGAKRMMLAEAGIAELRKHVDTLIIIPNQHLFRIANEKTTMAEAFTMADQVLYSGVRGITDLIVLPGLVNRDFADVRTIMAEMGAAMIGTGEGSGEKRAIHAAQSAVTNPLLDDVTMKGAKAVLINITGGFDMTLYEVDEATNQIRSEVDGECNIIWGTSIDPDMEGRIRVSVVATGIDPAASSSQRVIPRPSTPARAPETSRESWRDALRPPSQLSGQQRSELQRPDLARFEPMRPDVSRPEPQRPEPQRPEIVRPPIAPQPIVEDEIDAYDLARGMMPATPRGPSSAFGHGVAEEARPLHRALHQGEAPVAPPMMDTRAAPSERINLFAWRRNTGETPASPETGPARTETTGQAEDDDLEIPAFLRRAR